MLRSVVEVADRETQHAEHPVGPVDEGEALLLAKNNGLDAAAASASLALMSCAVDAHVALAHHREGAVRERREVARAPEAAVLADDRA